MDNNFDNEFNKIINTDVLNLLHVAINDLYFKTSNFTDKEELNKLISLKINDTKKLIINFIDETKKLYEGL